MTVGEEGKKALKFCTGLPTPMGISRGLRTIHDCLYITETGSAQVVLSEGLGV